MSPVGLAAWIMGLVCAAGLVSVETGISASILEMVAGVVGGNFLGLASAPWLDFMAVFGGVVLTFLAGTEVEPAILRRKAGQSVLIGLASFILPWLAVFGYCFCLAGWTLDASLIAGCALSTASLAVVYAVLVETGLIATQSGKILMAATFVTDLSSVAALSACFAGWDLKTAVFLAVSLGMAAVAPLVLPRIFLRYGSRVIEPEIKLLFLLLFIIMALGQWGRGFAVLPVFLLGLSVARLFRKHQELKRKIRVVSFAMITPFFFIKGGMAVGLDELGAGWRLFLALFFLKIAAKFTGIWPLARRYVRSSAVYTTLLLSTGLTFGTIAALYGLQEGHINRSQFSILVMVVVASAIIPTLIAQKWFAPKSGKQEEISAREEESA
jgi:Kef-type K+ transport system membrane component KefB